MVSRRWKAVSAPFPASYRSPRRWRARQHASNSREILDCGERGEGLSPLWFEPVVTGDNWGRIFTFYIWTWKGAVGVRGYELALSSSFFVDGLQQIARKLDHVWIC